jgi:hypothetical protein
MLTAAVLAQRTRSISHRDLEQVVGGRRSVSHSSYIICRSALGLVLAAGGPSACAQQSASAPQQIDVEVTCSQTKPGTSIAIIRFRAPNTARAGRESAARPQLDVTTSKTGFDTGAYMTLWPARREAAPQSRGGGRRSHELEPLSALRAVGPSIAARESARPQEAPPNGLSVIRSEGLEAGVNYFWRLRNLDGSSTNVVKVRGKSCPAESERTGRR